MKRVAIIGICLFNIAAVGYMGYLVTKIYSRPKPAMVNQSNAQTKEALDASEAVRQLLEAGDEETLRTAMRGIPTPLPLPEADEVSALILEPSRMETTFPFLRFSQRISFLDGLGATISAPQSLSPETIEKLEAKVKSGSLDPIYRQQLASILFDAALRFSDETSSEERERLITVSRDLLEGETLTGPLLPLRIRAWRLLHSKHPEDFPKEALITLAAGSLEAEQESVLLESIGTLREYDSTEQNAVILAMLDEPLPLSVKSEILRTLAATGGVEEARALVLKPTPNDLQLARALHETAEKILETTQPKP